MKLVACYYIFVVIIAEVVAVFVIVAVVAV